MTLLKSLVEWTAVHEEYAGKPMPLQPADDALLETLEAGCGMTLPDQLVELLQCTNGVPHRWSDIYEYHYFPSARFEDVSTYYLEVESIASDAIMMEKDWFLDGNGMKSIKLFEADLMIGIVCEGPETGRLWRYQDHPHWIAESLEHLVELSMQYHRNGQLDWNMPQGEDTGWPVGCGFTKGIYHWYPGQQISG